MTNYLIFGDVDSRDYGILVYEKASFDASHRDITAQSVPGKNGDVLSDNGRYENIEREFDCIIYEDMYYQLADFRDAICSKIGYNRIETSVHPDEYFMGYIESDTSIKTDNNAKLAKFRLTFNCKPQRFLKSGEETQVFTQNGAINNFTKQIALPYLKVYGTGEFGIGNITCTISEADEYTEIDCETMICKKELTPKGQYVSFSQYEYPTLRPGSNGIALGAGITKIEITPRWYKL